LHQDSVIQKSVIQFGKLPSMAPPEKKMSKRPITGSSGEAGWQF